MIIDCGYSRVSFCHKRAPSSSYNIGIRALKYDPRDYEFASWPTLGVKQIPDNQKADLSSMYLQGKAKIVATRGSHSVISEHPPGATTLVLQLSNMILAIMNSQAGQHVEILDNQKADLSSMYLQGKAKLSTPTPCLRLLNMPDVRKRLYKH
ncbi:hypothetical protein Cgig2_021448 [Carnegiea gigantea]|uniref:Uncharacterized protein n=1 Tax=Carnegiea gigantea TaxID=171969 RepID=A0A9Q1K139_9CARY|nr:hypothetical protein Cgig2_021448 [Carnegiea gigantea]